MNTKKIFSLILSSMVAALSVSSMVSNAFVDNTADKSSSKYIEYTSDKLKLDEKYVPVYESWAKGNYFDNCEYFIAQDGKELLLANTFPDYFTFDINISEDESYDVKKITEEIGSKIKGDLGVEVRFTNDGKMCQLEGIEKYSAKYIASYLKKDSRFSRFNYSASQISFMHILTATFLGYDRNKADEIAEYVKEHYDNAEIDLIDASRVAGGKDMPYVKLSDNAPVTDYLDIALDIYNDLGYMPFGVSPEIVDTESSANIDVENYVDGDANCDGEYTIADSTAILQSLGNPDKYGLSLQGEFNADICNVGDGVTTMDALEVQKAMASKG